MIIIFLKTHFIFVDYIKYTNMATGLLYLFLMIQIVSAGM